jgi:DNA-binding FrmR family transcriptional regulator
MAHTTRDKTKLLNRVRRIKGQVEGIEKALEAEKDCYLVLNTIVACRGALNGLMAEVLEGHIRFHVLDPGHQPEPEQAKAAEMLVDLIRAFLK